MYENDFMKRYREKYSVEVEQPQQQSKDIGAFADLIDHISKNNNPDLWKWVNSQENVKKTYEEMDSIFYEYLFEVMKPNFVAFCKQNKVNVVENYVNTCIETSKNYVSPLEKYEKERMEKDELIKKLLEERDQKMKTEVFLV